MKIEKILKIDETGIELSNGYKIEHYHDQVCCEMVYADWTTLDFLLENSKIMSKLEIETNLNKIIELVENAGFRLKIFDGSAINPYFIPCYYRQNGYYSSELIIRLLRNNKVIQELDISKTTISQYK